MNLKRIIIATILSLRIMQGWAFEYTYEDQTLEYDIIGKEEVSVKAVNNSLGGDLQIPSKVEYKNKKYKVTYIERGAFAECESLKGVVTPNSVITIGDGAFYGCKSLQRLVISESVVDIYEESFVECYNLSKIEVLRGNKHFVSKDDVLFNKSCDTLILASSAKTAYSIPKTVKHVASVAFVNCKKLQSIDIPNSVKSFGIHSFHKCEKLKSVVIPSSVELVWTTTFSGCLSLEKIEVSPNNKHYSSKDGVLFNKSGDTLLTFPGKIETYTIPNSVKVIECRAFVNCDNLQSVIIPNSVTTIKSGAFFWCTNLKDVVVPSSVTNIESQAFFGCEKLQAITIEAETPPVLEENYFKVFDKTILQTIYVPTASVEKYKAEGWNIYADKIQPIK